MDSNAIAIAGALISTVAAIYAGLALREARFTRFFSSFEIANQALLADPKLLYEVHGLDGSVPKEEAQYIAYLSTILDAYQSYWRSDLLPYSHWRAARRSKKQSTFLNRVLAVGANQQRWAKMKELFYGEFDRRFISAIDEIIAYEKTKAVAATP